MTLHRKSVMAFLMAGIVISANWAEEEDSVEFKTQFFGMGSYEFGQIVMGQYAKADDLRLDHYWQQQGLVQIGGEIMRGDATKIVLVGQGRVTFPYALPTDGSGPGGFAVFSPRYTWDISHAEALHTFGDPAAPILGIGAGIFPFKYNPDARNFGDYLLRISSYPQFLQTSFDAPYTRLLGLHINSDYCPLSTDVLSLHQDLLLTSEINLWPLRDFSLTYLFNGTLFRFADLGAGIMGNRMFTVDSRITRPPVSTNPHNFTFSSTKVMFRLALDFKRFLPLKELWGVNDWRIYGEACLNGLDNYPIKDTTSNLYPGYDKLINRLPVVAGINVPTCNILDVLSAEAEWWDVKFANSYGGVYSAGYVLSPNPYPYQRKPGGDRRVDPFVGSLHWSIYAKKTILQNIRLVAQVSQDHTFIETTFSGVSNIDPEEAVDGHGNWGWMAKVEYGF
jgi:hypothetical protein